MSNVAQIFTMNTTPVPGCVTIPYNGYEISMSTAYGRGEVLVFASRESTESLAEFWGALATSLIAAFKWVDENPKAQK